MSSGNGNENPEGSEGQGEGQGQSQGNELASQYAAYVADIRSRLAAAVEAGQTGPSVAILRAQSEQVTKFPSAAYAAFLDLIGATAAVAADSVATSASAAQAVALRTAANAAAAAAAAAAHSDEENEEKAFTLEQGVTEETDQYTFANGAATLEVKEREEVVVSTVGEDATLFASELLADVKKLQAASANFMSAGQLTALSNLLSDQHGAEYELNIDLNGFQQSVVAAEQMGCYLQAIMASVDIVYKVKDDLFVSNLRVLVARFRAAVNLITQVQTKISIGLRFELNSDVRAVMTNIGSIKNSLSVFDEYVSHLGQDTAVGAEILARVAKERKELLDKIKIIEDMHSTQTVTVYNLDGTTSEVQETVIDSAAFPQSTNIAAAALQVNQQAALVTASLESLLNDLRIRIPSLTGIVTSGIEGCCPPKN
jgi:hypothetical protein